MRKKADDTREPQLREATLKITLIIFFVSFSHWALAQDPKQCFLQPKDQALTQQMKNWQKAAQTMQDEVRHFTQELQAAYAQSSVDAQTEEKFRSRLENMGRRHRALYSEGNRLTYQVADRSKAGLKGCENLLGGEAEKLRLLQSSLYNDLLEADPMVKAAAHSLKARSS